jgi:hypothetical protein
VYHGDLSAGALVVGDEKPEVGSRIIKRALEKIPLALIPQMVLIWKIEATGRKTPITIH